MRILIAYGSTHGQTARIAERIAARMREHGHEVFVTGRPALVDAAGFDAVVVGARVHGSRYPWDVTRFIRRNLRTLRRHPSAFFSVSLVQLAIDPVQRKSTETLPGRKLARLGWTPDRIEVMGGALSWKRQYGILAPLFKRMWRHTLGDRVDPSLEEQVFTDWARVDGFAEELLRLATPSPPQSAPRAERAASPPLVASASARS